MADLLAQVYEFSRRRETKAEVIEGYREQAQGKMGKGGWRQAIIHDLAQLTGMKPKNLTRRFDPSRLGNVPRTNREREQYKKLGENLTPMAPEGGYHIWGIVWMKFSDGECEEREVDETIEGEEADALVKSATWQEMAQAVINHYMEDALWDEPSARLGDCNPPDLQVEAIE